jgi:hypothetical protein
MYIFNNSSGSSWTWQLVFIWFFKQSCSNQVQKFFWAPSPIPYAKVGIVGKNSSFMIDPISFVGHFSFETWSLFDFLVDFGIVAWIYMVQPNY